MGCAPAFAFNDLQFREQFSAFANVLEYPTPTLQAYYDTAGLIVANNNYGPLARAGATQPCLYLLTAHLAQIGAQLNAGQQGGIVVQATIDKINVTLQEFQYPNQFQFWLASTPYGAQLLAILQVQSVGGFSFPAGPGRAGFRF